MKPIKRVFFKGKPLDNVGEIRLLAKEEIGIRQYSLVDVVSRMELGEHWEFDHMDPRTKQKLIERFIPFVEVGEPAHVTPGARKMDRVGLPQSDLYCDVLGTTKGKLDEAISRCFNKQDWFWEVAEEKGPTIEDCISVISEVLEIKQFRLFPMKEIEWTVANLIGETMVHFGKTMADDFVLPLKREERYIRKLRDCYLWSKEHGKFDLTITSSLEVIARDGLTNEEKKKILQIAEDYALPKIKIRVLVEHAKKYGMETIDKKVIFMVKAGKNPAPKPKYWLVRIGNKWFEAQTPKYQDEIPVGDDVIRVRSLNRSIYQMKDGEMRHISPGHYSMLGKKKQYTIPKAR